MVWTSWRQFRDGNSDLVLCVDFAGGRAEAGFTDLVAHLPIGSTFLLARPADTGQDVVPAGALPAWLARWTDEVTSTSRPVSAMLGFCAGAPLAVGIADALAAAAARPPVVLLFDAVVVTGQTLAEEFVRAIESSAEHLTADEVTGAREWSETLLSQHDEDLAPIARGLVDRYRVLTSRLADRLGLDDFFAVELVAGFARYMSYLLVASEVTLGTSTEGLTLLSSKDHEPPVPGIPSIRFEVAKDDLLSDLDVAKTVADLVDRVRLAR